MKGMMVTLLVLLMTGMVVGQQATNPAASNQKVGRFVLDMSDSDINNLINHGDLRALIEADARNNINQVEIRHVGTNPNAVPAGIQQAPTTEAGVLNFEIGDAELRLLKSRGLRYMISSQEIGKYGVVAIKYTDFISPNGNQTQTRTQARTQQNVFGARNSGRGLAPVIPNRTQIANNTGSATRQTSNDLFNRKPFGPQNLEDRRVDTTRIQEKEFDEYDSRRQTANNFPTERKQTPIGQSEMSEFDQWNQNRKTDLDNTVAQTKSAVNDRIDRFTNGWDADRNTRTNEQLLQQQQQQIAQQERRLQQIQQQQQREQPMAQQQQPVNDRWRFIEQQTPDNRTAWNERNARNNRDARTETDARPVDLERLRQQRIAEENELLEQQRLANLEYHADQLEKQRKEKEIQERLAYELRMKDRQEAVERQRDRYAMVPTNRYPYTDDRRGLVDYVGTQNRVRRPQDFVDPLEDYDADYDRVAQLPRQTTTVQQPRSIAPIPVSINGPNTGGVTGTNGSTTTGSNGLPNNEKMVIADQTQLTRLNQQNKLLWFMMLCSLGLNIYLGWIARSFFGRYEELADELRETFTSTVN